MVWSGLKHRPCYLKADFDSRISYSDGLLFCICFWCSSGGKPEAILAAAQATVCPFWQRQRRSMAVPVHVTLKGRP